MTTNAVMQADEDWIDLRVDWFVDWTGGT